MALSWLTYCSRALTHHVYTMFAPAHCSPQLFCLATHVCDGSSSLDSLPVSNYLKATQSVMTWACHNVRRATATLHSRCALTDVL